VASIAGVFNARSLMESLAEKYSFVEENGLPDLIKKFTRTYAKYEMPSLYEEVHKLAYEYFRDKLKNDPQNKNYLINSLYYHFRVNEDRAYQHLVFIISYFIGSDINFCEKVLQEMSSQGLSKSMRDNLNILKQSLPYIILKDYKKTLPLLEAISELQKDKS